MNFVEITLLFAASVRMFHVEHLEGATGCPTAPAWA